MYPLYPGRFALHVHFLHHTNFQENKDQVLFTISYWVHIAGTLKLRERVNEGMTEETSCTDYSDLQQTQVTNLAHLMGQVRSWRRELKCFGASLEI